MAKQQKHADATPAVVVLKNKSKHLSAHIALSKEKNQEPQQQDDGSETNTDESSNMNDNDHDNDADTDTDIESSSSASTILSHSTSPREDRPGLDSSSTHSDSSSGVDTNLQDDSFIDKLRMDFISLRDEDGNVHDLNDVQSVGSSEMDIKGSVSIEIRDAIAAIRKEASQIDAIMAVDQLKTLRSELEIVTKQFQERSMEAEGLRQQLEASGEKIAYLELERDLHQADATKLKQDLKTCVDNIFDLSLVEKAEWEHEQSGESKRKLGPVALNGNCRGVPRSESDLGGLDRSLSKAPHSSQSPLPALLPNGSLRVVGSIVQHTANHSCHPQTESRSSSNGRKIAHRPPTLSDPGLLQIQYTTRTGDLTDDDSVFPLLTDYKQRNGDGRIECSNRQDVFRKRAPTIRRRMDSCKRLDSSQVKSHRRSRSLSATHSGTQQTIVCYETDDNEGERRKICSLLLCGGSKRLASAARNADVAMLKGQISNLHEMVRTSLDSSEKLRKRVATISKYYEGVIGKLQEQVVECKMEKNRMEIDLRNQLSQVDLDRRMVLKEKNAEIRRKNEEISILKHQNTRCEEVDKGEI